jgi:two-component system, response regulator PdtaR
VQRLRSHIVEETEGSPPERIGAETLSPRSGSVSRSALHAYIIEDDYLISQAIRDLLSDHGFSRFSFARSEDTAVAGAHGEKFDLITADVRLLPGDGVRAVEAICRTRQVPVIFVTGYPDDVKEVLEAKLPGATIVGKPLDVGELTDAVRKVMAENRST